HHGNVPRGGAALATQRRGARGRRGDAEIPRKPRVHQVTATGFGRREFLRRASAGALLLSSCRLRRDRPPNVIYAFSDEHRWQSPAFPELPQLRTPNLARLAAAGANFTHAVSNYPVCSPHRAMLMTGRWAWQQGVNDNGVPLAATEPTLGTVFRAAGYATA